MREEEAEAQRAETEDLKARIEILESKQLPTDDSAAKNTVVQALAEATRFFEHRDRMNAVVHLVEVRWSPITILVRQAWEEVSKDSQSDSPPAP
jgi:hypothetical protein